MDLEAISKMKVAELKKELKARGLDTTGAKQALVERLHSAGSQAQVSFEDGANDSEMLDEDDVLGEVEGDEFDDDDDDELITADAVLEDEPKDKATDAAATLVPKRPASLTTDSQEPQPKKRVLIRPTSVSSTGKENGAQEKIQSTISEEIKPTEKKIIKLTGVSVKERLELRAQKFGVPLSEAAKKEARAARFNSDSPTSSSGTTTTSSKITFLGPNEDVLKKRAERFGGSVSISAIKSEEEDKLKKRQERFGLNAATASSLEEKKKLRAQRFNL